MPLYEFACGECSYEWSHVLSIAEYESRPVAVLHRCPACGGDRGKRVFDVQIGRVVHEHTSPSYGTASSPRGIADNLKRMSDAASERTGIVHNFQQADPSDRKHLGVDDE